jgi:predicted ATPase
LTAPDPSPAPPAPPERLSHLKVAGFRSIRDLDIDLGDLTVLVGANGSGKSNFVGFFNLLSAMLYGNLQFYVQRKGGASSILHYGPKVTRSLDAALTFSGENGISTYDFSLQFAAPDRLIFASEGLEFKRVGEAQPFSRVLRAGNTESNLHEFARASDAILSAVACGVVKRLHGFRVYHFHDTSEVAEIRLSQDLSDNNALLANGSNLAAFLYMLQQSYPAHFDRILTTVRLAVPYLRDFVLERDRLSPGRIQLRWRDRSPDHEFGAHQLSDGSLRAIALITALMQPEELLPALIAIDEPELGLHPSAIATVAQLIRAVSRKRQVIVATQSSRLIAGFAPEEVVVVERDEDERGHGASTFKRLSDEALGAWREDYDLGQLYDMNVTGGGPQ